ncbi:MAG: hypothetical protein ACRCZI_14885, partial [Cetobacterium sp.]
QRMLSRLGLEFYAITVDVGVIPPETAKSATVTVAGFDEGVIWVLGVASSMEPGVYLRNARQAGGRLTLTYVNRSISTQTQGPHEVHVLTCPVTPES